MDEPNEPSVACKLGSVKVERWEVAAIIVVRS